MMRGNGSRTGNLISITIIVVAKMILNSKLYSIFCITFIPEQHDSDSVISEYNIRQECKEDELCKYKKYVPKVPMKGNFPDAIGWWKKIRSVSGVFPLVPVVYGNISLGRTDAVLF
jgi:hypothetical protein